MKLIRKSLLLVLVAAILLSIQANTFNVLAEAVSQPNVTVIQNDYIKVTVDNATGRYGIRTIEGQPIRKRDQNVDMLFRGDNPETSFTTFKINGTDYIFGNPYKFAVNLFSETTAPKVVENRNGTTQIETVWSIEGVSIKQILMLYTDISDHKNAGNVNIRYEVYNGSNASVELGTRMLLDTMVAGNDGPQFQIGTGYRAPLMVERKLVHDPAAIGIPEEDIGFYKLPPYWVMRDVLDLTNPLATNAIAYGFNNISENDINIVDEMIVGHWNGLANTKWDYEVNPNLDFTRDTNQYGTADSAVALYWQPEALDRGKSISFETVYGLGEVIQPDQVFSIRYMDPVQQLATLPDMDGYADEGVFDIIVEIENLPAFNMEHSEIRQYMTLESGLSFVKLDEKGDIVRDSDTNQIVTETFRTMEIISRKTATPEEAEQGIQPKYKPGDAITASFKVIATGRPWPTTKQYLLTVSSPETIAKLIDSGKIEGENDSEQAEEDEEEEEEKRFLLAEYESSQANFVLLPAIGEAAATYVYAMSPGELYSSDVKYITLNLTNIEAYNTGNEDLEPNFELYLKNIGTGDRYKIDVKDSVLLQPTDNGASGDMRITYRGGDKVNEQGLVVETGLGPELPLGEYQVEIDYTGDAGGDAELAGLFDLTTTQSFLVTNNDVARMRQANTIVIYKQELDLSLVPLVADEEDLQEINGLFTHNPFRPGSGLADAKTELTTARTQLVAKSRLIDPNLDVSKLLDSKTYEEVPIYTYELFSSDEDIDSFFNGREDREQLVTIRGMIKQVGTKDDLVTVVDTSTEPAIINEVVAYKGKDLAFVHGNLEAFGSKYSSQFLDTLFVRGDGVLSIANSGFTFHRGEWTIDFYNSFQKYLEEPIKLTTKNDNPEDHSLNGNLSWAYGTVGNRINPMRQMMLSYVYFNKQSLFNAIPLSVAGFSFEFHDAMLRPEGLSFGGKISFKIVEGEIKNVVFNEKGFVGVDAALRFQLPKELGLFKPGKETGLGGELAVTHYEQEVENKASKYGIKFNADIQNFGAVGVELAFKKVADGRVLPDVIGFSSDVPSPGMLITAGTYLTAVRGALRELADTIAGGSADDPFPLTLQAGVSLRFGLPPAYHFGDIDMTLKRTGIKLEGVLSFSTKEKPEKHELVPMITKALLEAQWVTPWFVRLQAEVDVMGWDVIIGKASIFVGQNLELNRTDFEGFLGAKVQVPRGVPIVGGMPLASVFFGVNNDKIWGSVGVLLISLGITYYWGGGIEFGTSGEDLPDGLLHMLVETPEQGQQLVVIGQGVETLATSWISAETANHSIQYHNVAEGVQVIDNGMSVGIGGITVENGGRLHRIPMTDVSGNALLEVDYDGLKCPDLSLPNSGNKDCPELTLRDANGQVYPLEFDNMNRNANANAFIQHISAADSIDGTDSYKAYIMIPANKLNPGEWTLTTTKKVETKLLNVPTTSALTSVNLESSFESASLFTANWTVENAKPDDVISLYLAEDAVNEYATSEMNGEAVLEAGDPGLLLAKDIPVAYNGGTEGTTTSGSYEIDVTAVSLLGGTEDIRGLLRQGNYYLRAELKSAIGYETMTSNEQFLLLDPLAPEAVSDISIEPAGNGMFELSFRPGTKKAGQQNFEHSYMIEAFNESDRNELLPYANFSELLFTEQELAPYWNEALGKYEGMLIGGWNAVDGAEDENGNIPVHYIGLETGKEYVIGVTAATKPTKEWDEHENYHFAFRNVSTDKLLPIPTHPQLRSSEQAQFSSNIELLTNEKQQSISLLADQENVEVEAFFNGESLGKAAMVNANGRSQGSLTLDSFTEDGTYAIELMAKNSRTKDKKITMLYLTVDTMAPILYLERPISGDRTKDGQIRVTGQTTNDANLTVNGTEIVIDRSGDGSFDATIPVQSGDPTVTLQVIARDDAGNENRAELQITNDAYRAPVALLLREMKLEMGESRKLEASLRVPDGLTIDGKAKYKTVVIPDRDYNNLLTFSIAAGSATEVDEGGEVSALAVGASLLQAEYELDGIVLQAQLPVNVVQPVQNELAALDAYTSAVATNKTKVIVKDAGDLTGYQLVYNIFTGNETAVKPQFNQDLSNWTLLPADGIVEIAASDRIIVAKRESLSKLASAASSALVPQVSSGSGGGGGAIPIIPELPTEEPTEPEEPNKPEDQAQELYANGQPIHTEWQGNSLIATLTADDLTMADNGVITVASGDKATKNIVLRIEQSAREAIVASGGTVNIDLSGIKMTLTSAQLAATAGDYELLLSPNDASARQSATNLVRTLSSTLLGSGQGITIATNTGERGKKSFGKIMVAVPQQVRVQDISAVVLVDANGEWTPLPWSINMDKAQAYAEIVLTGEGSVFFVRNTPSFSDVRNGYWAKDVIEQAAKNLLVFGKGNNRFDPNSIVSRAEFPTMLLRSAGLMTQTGESHFTDVNEQQWFYRSVSIATKLGIVSGTSEASFSPSDTLTRAQGIAMVGRLLEAYELNADITDQEVSSILKQFQDSSSIPEYARKPAALAVKYGIIQGTNNRLNPEAALTRAQAAVIITQLQKLLVDKGV